MIRVFVLTGIIGGIAIAYLSVFALGPTAQLPPSESLLVGYREDGFVPQSFNLAEDESVDHDTFEVPEQDAVELAKAEAAMAEAMGMEMGAGDAAPMDNMAQDEAMPQGEAMGQETAPMDMAGEAAPHDEAEAVGGLKITDEGDFDREINMTMTEWGFSDSNIEVVKGERIRFNITNEGEILHEFMVMEMTAMQAINYRMNRADWSLLEHEALYEKALVLPDGDFSFVMEVQEDGVWMFMCMLPYHMEMGMMGQLATAGNAMEM